MPNNSRTNCSTAADELSEYVDGGLSVDEVRAISEHLSACQPCERLKLEIEEIRIAARELPLHTPNQNLWKRVRAEVEAEIVSEPVFSRATRKPSSWWQRLAEWKVSLNAPQLAGAALMVAILAGSAPLALRSLNSGLKQQGSTALSAALIPGEHELSSKVDAKLSEFNARKVNWDPQLRRDFESFLERIDQSLQGCRQQLVAHPDDRDHQRMYLALYEEKLRLLEDVNELAW
jgi:hypothetical protein